VRKENKVYKNLIHIVVILVVMIKIKVNMLRSFLTQIFLMITVITIQQVKYKVKVLFK